MTEELRLNEKSGSKEGAINNKKENLEKWLLDKHNWVLIGIIVLAIAIRIYYFSLTKSQPLWWDEADYLAYAKNLAGFNVSWIVTPQHNSIFPYLVALFFKIGFSEAIIKFILEIIPSILVVFLTYLISITLYNSKKIALISTFLMAVFGEILFNSMRFHLEAPALLFGLLSIYVFFKGYERKEKIFGKISYQLAIPITVVLVILTYSIRRGYFLFGFFFLFYMLATKNWKELAKDKYNWIGLAIAIFLLILIEMFVFTASITQVAGTYTHQDVPLNLSSLDVFRSYFTDFINGISVLFYLFYFGLVLMFAKSFIYFRKIRSVRFNEVKSDIFILLTIIITLSYFIFIQRATDFGEPRWYFPLLLGTFICISQGTIFLSDFIKKHNKKLAIALIIILIVYGGYYQVKYTDAVIVPKVTSFEGIKEAGLFIKSHSSQTDKVISVPAPQPAYYAERDIIRPFELFENKSNKDIAFDEFLNKIKDREDIRFIIVTFSEPNHPQWMRYDEYYARPDNGQNILIAWHIPFMNSSVNLLTGESDLKQEQTYGNITFKFAYGRNDAFVYEIIHDS